MTGVRRTDSEISLRSSLHSRATTGESAAATEEEEDDDTEEEGRVTPLSGDTCE